ncbi:MAG: bifunctional 2-acylglycerophosphoethanolamine acyltransferase/acyl-ACP synthetase [Candidatus Solibacter sp.]|nr:bifunctional 2-acylglycerophosphoethanolamine acyltransferase/acyl-ACP synthetase [Candidatus Solibacter sp.]
MLRHIIRFLLRTLYGLRVEGAPPRAGKLLFIANHQSFLDAVLLWATLPDSPLWVVHTQVLRQTAFRALLKHVDHVVLDTLRPMAMKFIVEAIESGRPAIIFPEGRVTVTGVLMKIYDGPAFLAAKSGATIAPVWIDGAVHARGFSRMNPPFPLRLFPRIRVVFHTGRTIAMPDAPTGKLRRRKASEEMRRLMQRLMLDSFPSSTIHQEFLRAVELHGRKRIMVEDASGTEMTYGLLLRASLALGRLVSRLTAENETVGVLMPNAAGTLALYFGLLGIRRIPAFINFTAGADGVQSACKAARIRTILTSRAFIERAKLQPLIDQLTGVKVVLLEDLRAQLTLADKLWLILFALRSPRRATLQSRPEDPAAILFTSGSEGKPKGVVLSNRAMLANVRQCLSVVDVGPSDRFMSAMPVFHSFGLTAGFLLPILNGIPAFLYPSPLHYAVVPEMFYDRDCTVMFATPTFLKNYARRAHAYDLRKVRFLLAGAEKLTAEIRDLYNEKFGARVLEGYGATECSPVIAVNTPMRAKSGSVGELLPGMECRFEAVPGIEDAGLLHVRGPNVMSGYLRDSNPGVLEPPSSIFGEGWYATGDLAILDDDGFLVLKGRVKRFAKVAGEMVSLEVVEKLAETASPASIHAAICRPDPARGEMIVLLTQDNGLRREHLQQSARDLGAPELAIPRRVLAIGKIPLLGNGKKDYPTIQKLAEELLAGQ